ncbi:hypothetical protein [Embleya scabrispora]|uniref:hypothetical protein n=1 Tax=Embleya scabrispora TaxID=159449 RepID=UPI0003802298|nr:hypothetical protein [Embleya scabrispora]MYS81981.1 hypothetical protein [Streptomyces sp. SID5474]
MGDFVRAALAFPAVLFSFALVVVAAYWLLVLLGGVAVGHGGHGDHGGGHHGGPRAHGGHDGHGGHAGHGDHDPRDTAGVPITVTVSFAIAVTWFVCLVGTALTDRWWLRAAALPAALGLGLLTARLVRALGRRFMPLERPSVRADFVGRTCLIRTGRVGLDFGQAEVRAEDGSTAILQVRTDESGLASGSTALIFDYDAAGEFFRVTRYDSALDPDRTAR